MSVFQGYATERVVYLTLAGSPVTGVLDTDITLRFRKKGGSFQEKTMTPSNFTELEAGFYAVGFESSEMDTLGQFVFRITAGPIEQYVQTFDIDPVYLGAITPPGICIVSGNIVDLGGDPVWNSPVSFRIVDLPKVVDPSLVAGDFVRTITDVAGNFYVSLIRGATVIAEIPKTALRIQFEVPDQETANIVDLIPS